MENSFNFLSPLQKMSENAMSLKKEAEMTYNELKGPAKSNTRSSVKITSQKSSKIEIPVKPKKNNEIQSIERLLSSFENEKPMSKVFKLTIDSNSYKFDNNKYFNKYQEEKKKQKQKTKTKSCNLAEGKIQNTYEDGSIEIILPSGATRETFPNGYSIVQFINEDIKQTLPDGSLIYYHGKDQITHITLPNDKTEVISQDLSIWRLSSRISLSEWL